MRRELKVEFKETKDSKVHKELKVPQVHKVLPKEIREHKEPSELKVQQVLHSRL